jgi:hypothetical protein
LEYCNKIFLSLHQAVSFLETLRNNYHSLSLSFDQKGFRKKVESKLFYLLFLLVALLSGARNEKDSSLAALVFERMEQLFPGLTDSLTSASVLLANVYGATGDLEKASDIRNKLNKSGVKKQIGISSTVLNGRFYVSCELL